MDKELLSLTCKSENATVFAKQTVHAALKRAEQAFPDYHLIIGQNDEGLIIRTYNMAVQRYLRA